MLIKLIKCIVKEPLRSEFQTAQSQWSQLASVKGFIAQFGGWNRLNMGEAVIVGLWCSIESYQYFMTEVHDQILKGNKQSGLFESIEVSLWSSNENIHWTAMKALNDFGIYETLNDAILLKPNDGSIVINSLKEPNNRKILQLGDTFALQALSYCSTEAQARLIEEWTVERLT